MALKSTLGSDSNELAKKRSEYKNNFLQTAVVLAVNPNTSQMVIRYASGKTVEIPFEYKLQVTGSADISVPSPGDFIYVYQDSIIHGLHMGSPPYYYPKLVQDAEVTDATSTAPKLPFLASGNRFLRASQGSSILLTDNFLAKDALENSIELNSDEDKLETHSSSISLNGYSSEIKAGATKRYRPDLNKFYESIIPDPNGDVGLSEFTVFLGKSLEAEATEEEFKSDSSTSPVGKEKQPKVIFSMSDSAVADIDGDLPSLNGQKLNFLFQLADKFAFKVANNGSFLLGNANASGVNGIYLSNHPTDPVMTIGTALGNKIVFQRTGLLALENSKGYYKIFPNGLVNLGNEKFQLIADPDGPSFQIVLTTSPSTVIKADSSKMVMSAADNTLTFKKGELQIASSRVNIGQPNLTSLQAYEPAVLGESLMKELFTLNTSLLSLVTALSTPILGAAAWPQVNTAAASTIPVITAFLSKVPPLVSPLLSKQVNIGS